VHVQEYAEPFAADGGPVGVLLLHGLTGSPQAVRPWARHHAAAGLTVAAPRLPGHGTTWQGLNRTRWPDWYTAAERQLHRLRARCTSVFVGGLSMGGCLALRLAADYDDVAGLIVVNPSLAGDDARLFALPLLRYAVPSLSGIGNAVNKPGVEEGCYDRLPLHALHSLTRLWQETRRLLPTVRQPLLLLRSAGDPVVGPRSSALVLSRVGSVDVTQRVLSRSSHVATLDHDAPLVFTESLTFIDRVTRHRQAALTGASPESSDAR
jgi:carboxylesterase